MVECTSRHFLTEEFVYLVLLEFPSEDQEDEDLAWLQASRSKIEEFCDEHCFKIGGLYMLPKPYFSIVESFLRKWRMEYKRRGYNPTFRFLKVNLRGKDYLNFQMLILEKIKSRLENQLSRLDKEKLSNVPFSEILREVTKANELILIFHLSKAFPEETDKIYDLISILNEKIAEFKIHKPMKVMVTEL